MPNIYFSDRQVAVTRDVLSTIQAYTEDELVEHFGWDDDEIEAWVVVLGKLLHAQISEEVRRDTRRASERGARS